MFTKATILALVGLAYGHGIVTSPPVRRPGQGYIATCGQQANNNMGNPQGNVQGILQTARNQADYNPATCNLFLCKGFAFSDNSANVQSYTVGQTVPFRVTIGAPHTGVMNVSVVNTATNSVIGAPLISMEDYASNAHTIPASNTAFDVTIPDVGGQCGTPGACVLQWFWDATGIDQTYEDCVDFTVGGSGGGAAPPAAPAAPRPSTTVAAAATSAAAASPVVTTRAAVASPSASLVPELECDDDAPVPAPSASVVPELECDDDEDMVPELECDDDAQGVIGRRHPRDFDV